MYGGWHQVAFSRDLEGDVTPAAIGTRRLMLVRRGGTLAAFDATCPHRGAHLGHGGRLEGDVVVCPFHGHRITLGGQREHLSVASHPTLEIGGLVFVRLSERNENGLTAFLEGLDESHWFVPGFTFHVAIAPPWIIENAFDADHFHTVHAIDRRPELTVQHAPAGHLTVDAVFETSKAVHWQEPASGDGTVHTRFHANVFSPTVIVTELGRGDRPNIVLTAATPDAGGESDVRVSVLLPGGPQNEPPERDVAITLLRDSRTAFEQDLAVWAHLDTEAPNHLGLGDRPVIEYRRFCDRFEI
jgi:3-ketosteroid 9alpha-monooxygenase subunit A